MGIPVSGSKVIPDQLFALKYPDGYRAFALEVDRGTEPVRSNAARKSLARSITQYQTVLDQRLHKQHYGLKSNLAVLWVFNSARRQMQFQDLVGDDRRFKTARADLFFPRFAEVVEKAKTLVGPIEAK
jgi:hypothetical protein